MIDYGTLKLIWWLFIFVLFALFFVFGGRDFGVCILLPWLGKNDDQRRTIINSIGSTWEGNQVWFVTAGGATFAAWPIVYATAFSGLYYALLLVLLSLILRPPGFDFRSKMPSKRWRDTWDWCLFVSGFVPSLVFGVALGNLFLGLPYQFDHQLLPHYTGSFFALLNPFSVLFGLAAVCILTLHGGVFLQRKLGDEFAVRLKLSNTVFAIGFLILFCLLGWWINTHTQGYQITQMPDKNSAFVPMLKQVSQQSLAWAANYQQFPVLWSLPIITLVAVFLALLCSLGSFPMISLLLTSLGIITALATAACSLFPFIMPSSLSPNHSLTIWDATSSHRTLFYMFIVAVIFLPIILTYTFWAFRVLRGKIQTETVINNVDSY